MYKNTIGQHVAIFAWDGAAGTPKTGDAANITAWVGKDGSALLGSDDINPIEIGFGIYDFDVAQAESNCDLLIWTAESSTTDVSIRPVIIYTQDLGSFKATGFSIHDAADVKTAMEAAGTKLTEVKTQTDKMSFTGTDIKATLDGEEVTTDATSRNASKADVSALATTLALSAHDTKLNTVDGIIDDLKRAGGWNKMVLEKISDTQYTETLYDDVGAVLRTTNITKVGDVETRECT